MLERHGRLSLGQNLAPAIRFAREGFRLCKTSAMWFQVAEEVLKLTEETRKNFFDGDRVYVEGEKMRFPELADTLESIGEEGVELFYEGELARRLSSYILKRGGIITERDLARALTGRGPSTRTVLPRRGDRRWPRCSGSSRVTIWPPCPTPITRG